MKKNAKGTRRRSSAPGAISLLFMIGFLISGFTWPGQKEEKKEPEKKNTQQEKKEEKKPVPASAAKAAQDPDVTKIQAQINDILRVNERVKQSQLAQTAEIQRATEQALIHQRILRDLQAARIPKPVPNDPAEIVRREKIRLIQTETEKNYKLVQDIQNQNRNLPNRR